MMTSVVWGMLERIRLVLLYMKSTRDPDRLKYLKTQVKLRRSRQNKRNQKH
jgi:hypothetical protein